MIIHTEKLFNSFNIIKESYGGYNGWNLSILLKFKVFLMDGKK